jgi:multiple RNA-binding domain-containing protein 1
LHRTLIHRSRLIILNLPPTVTPASLRSQLTQPANLKDATITDLKVNTKRRFAFVGYKTVGDAEKAKNWFDGSFALGGGKVKVDFVRDEVGHGPRCNRREADAQPLAPKPKRVKLEQPPKKDSQMEEAPAAGPSKQLQEWMDVMKGTDSSVPGGSAGVVPGEEGWVADGLQKDKKKAESKKGQEKAQEAVDEEETGEDDDDAAWLRKRQTAQLAEPGSAAETVKAVGWGRGLTEPNSWQADAERDLILSTGRLFVRNLAFSVTSEDLSAQFSRYGHIESVHLPVSQSGEPLGTAYVLYRDPADAWSAYQALDKTTFQGRLLHVLPGRARPGQEVKAQGVGEVQGGVLGKVKQGHSDVLNKSDAKKKADNAKGVNWATLYMNVSRRTSPEARES